MISAAELNISEIATISDIDNTHSSAYRLLEIGFTPGQKISLLNKSIFNDPLVFCLRGTLIAIRRSEAECIKCEK